MLMKLGGEGAGGTVRAGPAIMPEDEGNGSIVAEGPEGIMFGDGRLLKISSCVRGGDIG